MPEHIENLLGPMLKEQPKELQVVFSELVTTLKNMEIQIANINKKMDDGFLRTENRCKENMLHCSGVQDALRCRLIAVEKTDAVDAAVRLEIGKANDMRMEQVAQAAMDRYFTRVKTAQAVGIVSMISATLIGLGQWVISLIKAS